MRTYQRFCRRGMEVRPVEQLLQMYFLEIITLPDACRLHSTNRLMISPCLPITIWKVILTSISGVMYSIHLGTDCRTQTMSIPIYSLEAQSILLKMEGS